MRFRYDLENLFLLLFSTDSVQSPPTPAQIQGFQTEFSILS